jgi:hypothetical protein
MPGVCCAQIIADNQPRSGLEDVQTRWCPELFERYSHLAFPGLELALCTLRWPRHSLPGSC